MSALTKSTNAAPLKGGEPTSRPASAAVGRQEFEQDLRLLDRSTTWLRWSGFLMLLLVLATMTVLGSSAIEGPGPWPGSDTLLSVQVLLPVMLVIQVFTLWEQRHLRTLRAYLVEQMETAVRQSVRADNLYGLSILDPLTGLYNRRFGETRLNEEIERAASTGTLLMLVAIDFDRFKEINDRHGHAAGDMALKEFARRLQKAIRASDVPIRVGGDEFLVVLPECPLDQMHGVLSRLTSFELKLGARTIPVTFSLGVARHQVGDTATTMIQRADTRLYVEKEKRSSQASTDQRHSGVASAGIGTKRVHPSVAFPNDAVIRTSATLAELTESEHAARSSPGATAVTEA